MITSPEIPVADQVVLARVRQDVAECVDRVLTDTGPGSHVDLPVRAAWKATLARIDAAGTLDELRQIDMSARIVNTNTTVERLIAKAVAAQRLTDAERAVRVREHACARLDTDVARADGKATATASATALIGGGAVTVAAATGGLEHLPLSSAIAAGLAGIGVLATLGACAAIWWPAHRGAHEPFATEVSIEEHLALLDAHHRAIRGLFDRKTRLLRAAIVSVAVTTAAAVTALAIALIGA